MRFRLNPPVTTSPFIRYAVSVVTSVAAFALNISFSSESGRPLFLIYAVAAGLSAWTGGFMPGLLSVLLGASGAAFLLIRSSGNFQAIARFDHFRFGLYVIASLCLVWLIAELHAARMALLRRDEHFRRAQRSARISAFEWNLDSGEVIWSEELPAVQGRGPDKDFESWMLNVHPEDREQLRQALRRAIEHGEDLSVDLRLREAQGPNNWVSLRAEIERDGSGEPVRALGVVIDITARKLTERRLAARHATSLILSGSRSLAEAAPRVLASICECLGWEVGVLWNQPEGALSLHCHSVYAPDQGFEEFVRSTQAQSFAPGIGLPGRVWKSGEAAWISDLAQDTNFPRSDAALQERLQSAFAFPLKTAAGVAGVVEFLTCELRPPDRELLDMMSDLGSHIGQFIERTHAQTELRQSEERYRTLTETASDMILTINANSTIVFANRATERVLGYELDELIGKSITVLMPHDLRDLHLNGLPRYLRTGQRQMSWDGVELAALHKNGHEVQLEISFSAFVAHGERMFTGVARDVTERKRVADALRESERWLATTLNSIGDAVIATDGTGCVRLINPIAESLTGWAASEAIGSRLDQVFRLINDQHQTMENPAARIGRTGGNLGIVEQGNVVSRQGDEIAIEIIGTPMRDDRGRFAGAVLVFRDIRSRRRAEAALRNSEKLAATGRLAATIAHEINNPMESVVNLLYLLQNDAALTAQQRHFVTLAEQEVGRITHIVQQTLGFYREASSPVPVKVSHLLDNVLQLYSRRLGLRGVRVEKTYEFDKDIEVFPGEMRQVFSNLVANAIEALPPGGRVRLHLYPSRNWHTLEEGIRVVVADNGPGISPENRRQIFEPFFTTKGERGTGLGLWVSRGIVQKHGGRLTMRSTTRHGCSGTVFSVFLPCAREKRLRATSSETAA